MSANILVVTLEGEQCYPCLVSGDQGCCWTPYSAQTAPLAPAKNCLASNVNSAKVEKPSSVRAYINDTTAMLTSRSDESLLLEKGSLRVWNSECQRSGHPSYRVFWPGWRLTSETKYVHTYFGCIRGQAERRDWQKVMDCPCWQTTSLWCWWVSWHLRSSPFLFRAFLKTKDFLNL